MTQTLSETMQRIKQQVTLSEWAANHLRRATRGHKYVCPICGSGGNGSANSDSALSIRGDRWHCFSCQNGGDIFDLYGAVYGTDDSREQAQGLADEYGIWTGDDASYTQGEYPRYPEAVMSEATGVTPVPDDARPEFLADYTSFYEQAHQNLLDSPEALAYLHGRGITDESIERYQLGYIDGWTHPKTGKYPTKRIIIPRTGATYVARAIDESERYYDKAYAKQIAGTATDVFNLNRATGADAIVVVEGELDAISVEQVTSYAAVGLGSISNVKQFPLKAKTIAPDAIWLLALDNDKAKEDGSNPGQQAQAELLAGMRAAGLTACAADGALYGIAKDANAALVTYQSNLGERIEAEMARARREVEDERTMSYTEALARLRVLDPSTVAQNVFDLTNARDPLPTCWASINEALGGGLPSRGLVTLGAVSSVGKTTFALQLADELAAAGRTVLTVTIEQSAEELVSKSLSRLIGRTPRRRGGRMFASSQAITSMRERQRWAAEDPEKAEALLRACETYERMMHRDDGTQRLYIMEAANQPTVQDIRTVATDISRHDGGIDLIVIDYLQLLAAAPGHERDSDKMVVDANVMALRQMARDLDVCVLAISSLNRASYNGSVTLESFKESGSVEYGSDLLLGLQPRGFEEELDGKSEAAAKRAAKSAMRDFKSNHRRECEVVILKNRNAGIPRDGVGLIYDCISNSFYEEGEERAIAEGRTNTGEALSMSATVEA